MKKIVIQAAVVLCMLLIGYGAAWADSACVVDFKSLDTGVSRRIYVNEPLTFTANAVSSCDGNIYYRFDLIPNYGTDSYDAYNAYLTIQDFSVNNQTTYTFSEPGNYILAVFASPNPSLENIPAPSIMGGSITVMPAQSDTDVAVDVAQEVAMLTSTAANAYSTQDTTAISGNTSYSNNGCPQVTLQRTDTDKILTITYGSGCEVNGIPMSGVISGSWVFTLGQGLDLDLAFDTFTVDGESVDGTVSINASSVQGSQIIVSAQLTFAQGGDTQTLTVTNLSLAVDTNLTLSDPSDDTYTLNGSGSFVDSDANTYSVTFTNVVAEFGCYVPVSGTMTILSTDGGYSATVNFGDGSCDTIITVSTGNVSQPVDLSDLSGL